MDEWKGSAYLNFYPCTVYPCSVVCHKVSVGEGLDPHFYFASIVEDTTITIQKIYHGRQRGVGSGIRKDAIIPAFEVGIGLDECGKGLPFIGRSNEAWAVGTCSENVWCFRLEGIFGPGKGIVGRRVERGGSECGSICLR